MKYAGSKNRIAKHIIAALQPMLQFASTWLEPFVGGGNMIMHVPQHLTRLGFDANKYVVALLAAVRGGWIPEEIDKTTYYYIKGNPDAYPDYLVGWAAICCSYCGKWWGGYAGVTQTKAGTTRDYQEEARRNLIEQGKQLQGVRLGAGSYADLPQVTENEHGKVLWYCDPPYKGTLKYKDEFNSDLFYDWVRQMALKGAMIAFSEYNAPDDFICVWSQEVKSSLSANGDVGGSKKSIEKLFVHKTTYEQYWGHNE